MPLFRSKKDIEFVKSINREVIERVIGEKFTYYAISDEYTKENFYGEAKEKIFHAPVEMYGLIEWLDQTIKTDSFGQDIIYRLEIHVLEEYLNQIEAKPTEGDYIDYDSRKFEITQISEPIQIFAKAGETIGRKLICQSVRESQFNAVISGTIEQPKRTRPDDNASTGIQFDNVLFPFSSSTPSNL